MNNHKEIYKSFIHLYQCFPTQSTLLLSPGCLLGTLGNTALEYISVAQLAVGDGRPDYDLRSQEDLNPAHGF